MATQEEVAEMANAGMTSAQIADELGISADTVRRLAREAGVKINRSITGILSWSAERVEDFLIQYRGGASVRELCDKFGFSSYTAFYQALLQIGEPTRTKTIDNINAKLQQIDLAMDMYKRGSPLYAIVEETGVAQVTIHHELHRRGIPLRRPHRMSVDD